MTHIANDNRAIASARPVMSTKDAARFLGVSHRTLEDWRLTNSGPRFVKLGRLVLYRLSDLQDYMDRNCFSHTGAVAA
ncbi:MAG: helix-turn-helix transcriptional regulator [Brevundimonas sp.]